MAAFVEATLPTGDELHALLQTIASRLMKMTAHSQESYRTVPRSHNAVPPGGRARPAEPPWRACRRGRARSATPVTHDRGAAAA
jgi:hypothetical protein